MAIERVITVTESNTIVVNGTEYEIVAVTEKTTLEGKCLWIEALDALQVLKKREQMTAERQRVKLLEDMEAGKLVEKTAKALSD